MFIPDPGSWFLSIPDPGWIQQQQQKRRGGGKNLLSYIFLWPQISQHFELVKKKMSANLQRIVVLLPQKFGIRKKSVPDPRSGGKKCTGSWILIRNTGKNQIKTYETFIIFAGHVSAAADGKAQDVRPLRQLRRDGARLLRLHQLHDRHAHGTDLSGHQVRRHGGRLQAGHGPPLAQGRHSQV
jgi:hypothetical protein